MFYMICVTDRVRKKVLYENSEGILIEEFSEGKKFDKLEDALIKEHIYKLKELVANDIEKAKKKSKLEDFDKANLPKIIGDNSEEFFKDLNNNLLYAFIQNPNFDIFVLATDNNKNINGKWFIPEDLYTKL